MDNSLQGTLTPMRVLQGTLNGGIAYGTFNYNELENKPSINGTELVGNITVNIPTKTSDLTNDSGYITDADVPTKTSELTNDSGYITVADVPSKTSELTNDSGFITENDIPEIPTKTSQLNNDSGYLTMLNTPVKSVNSQTGDVNLFIPNATSQLTNDAGFITDADIPVTSVNGQTGDVELTADNIPFDSNDSIAEKVNSLTAEDLSYDGGTDTVYDVVEEVKDSALKIANVHSLKGNTAITSSTTYSYTGVRIDIPANSIYSVMATAVYLDNSPSRCAITSSSTSGSTLPCSNNESGGHKTVCVNGYVSSAISLYVWAQYAGAGANRIDTDGYYITLE